MSSPVPEEIKRNVRSVLLSKVGGVQMNMFLKDYKSLVLEQLDYRALGFQRLQEFFSSIPEIARIQKIGSDIKVFGVGDPNTYLSVGARKAQGKLPKNYLKNLQAAKTCHSDPEGSSATDMELSALEPDYLGWFSLCCPIDKAPSTDRMELETLFLQAGSDVKIFISPKWVFVRYKSKEECSKALGIFEEYGIRVATSKNNKPPGSEADEKEKKGPLKGERKPNGLGPKSFRDRGKDAGYFTDVEDRKKQRKPENKQNGYVHKENGFWKPKKGDPKALFVHGISDDEAFQKLIEPYKPVHTRLVQHQGGWIGFLEMKTEEDAKTTIAELNHTKIGEKYIIVDYDTPTEAKADKSKKDPNGISATKDEGQESPNKRNKKPPQKPTVPPQFADMPALEKGSSSVQNENYYLDCTVYVGNFPANTTFVALQEAFRKYHVKDIIIGNISASEGCTRAYLYLASIPDVIQCVEEMNNFVMGDSTLKVDVPYKNEKMRLVLKNRLQLRMFMAKPVPKLHY